MLNTQHKQNKIQLEIYIIIAMKALVTVLGIRFTLVQYTDIATNY